MRFRVSDKEYNKIREKEMFKKEDLEFIKESAEKDLEKVKSYCQSLIDDLAYLGARLGESNATKDKLERIVESIAESDKNKDEKKPFNPYMYSNSRCC